MWPNPGHAVLEPGMSSEAHRYREERPRVLWVARDGPPGCPRSWQASQRSNLSSVNETWLEIPDERYKAGRANDITAPTNPYSGIANLQQQKARPDPTAPATTSSKHKDQQKQPHAPGHLQRSKTSRVRATRMSRTADSPFDSLYVQQEVKLPDATGREIRRRL